jgi:hypothetical protein
MARTIENGQVVDKPPRLYAHVIGTTIVGKKAIGWPYPPGPPPAGWVLVTPEQWAQIKIGYQLINGQISPPADQAYAVGETLEEQLARMQAEIRELQQAVKPGRGV